jgi:hypothetical protein
MSAQVSIAVQCHNFQKRLCWMLSSLCQQSRLDLFRVDVAYFAGNGNPGMEAILAYYKRWIAIKQTGWTDYATFQKRGLVRNQQLHECQSEWVLFSDCDMVFHPEYFERLSCELTHNHSHATYMISAGRYSNPKESANQLVDSQSLNLPFLIPKAFFQVNRLSLIPRRNVGAGYSQIINLNHAPHGRLYVDPASNLDWSWESRYQKARSDLQFRKKISLLGGPRRSLPFWFTVNQIHLNHNRDSEFGFHLEEQR